MLLECRNCKHPVHDSRSWPKEIKDIRVLLLWFSGLALAPAVLVWEDVRYLPLLPLLPVALLGGVLWLLRQAVEGLARAITYLRFVGRKCPSCGRRKWTWPILDLEDVAM